MANGMRPTRTKDSPNRYLSSSEPYLNINSISGINTDGDHSNLAPGELRSCVNFDLYKKDIRTRRGLTRLTPTVEYSIGGNILQGIVWDTGDSEFFIYYAYTTVTHKGTFNFLNLSSPTTYATVQNWNVASDFQLNSNEAPDMLVLNSRLYCFTADGNFVIEQTSPGVFKARTMGLTAPTIFAASLPAGSMTGMYVIGCELIYMKDGVIVAGSTPNNTFSNGALVQYLCAGQKLHVLINSATLPSGSGAGNFATHVRMFVSRNLNRDVSDPANPIGPFGTGYELYPSTVISIPDLIAASYYVDINSPDSQINKGEVWEIDRIGLTPLPAGTIGAPHKGRLYVGRCKSTDPTESNIYYSNFANTIYSEQSNPLQVINVLSGDGQKVIRMQSLNNNLVLFKETKTLYLANGNVDLPPIVSDINTGIVSKRLMSFVPQLGFVGITSDNTDLKIFSSQTLSWSNVYGTTEISRQIRSYMPQFIADAAFISMIYINGKLMILDGGYNIPGSGKTRCLVLHVEQNKGWTEYQYDVGQAPQFMATYQNNSRAFFVGGSDNNGNLIFEIEVFNNYNDAPVPLTPVKIPVSLTTHMFQNNNALDLLELSRLQVSASLSGTNLQGTCYVNELPWLSETNISSKPDVSYLLDNEMNGIFEITPSKRAAAPLMYFTMKSSGDIKINMMRWVGIINKNLTLNSVNRNKSRSIPVVLLNPLDVIVNI